MENHLEQAAKKTLAKIIGMEEVLKPLYLQPDRAIFLAASSGIILKIYEEGKMLEKEYTTAQRVQAKGVPLPDMLLLETGQPAVLAMKQVVGRPLSSQDGVAAKEAGRYIERVHSIKAAPPFLGGQDRWDEFILGWAELELGRVERLDVFTRGEIDKLRDIFARSRQNLQARPVVLLHGDLQPVHILIEPITQRVVAFLDFADVQPGDPLLDIAILSLWDTKLADAVLDGYEGMENDERTRQLLWLYRLLRHTGEIPWLLDRGFKEYAERDIRAVKEILLHKDQK